MNALKHGMTGKIVLPPEEDGDEFRRRMNGWFDSLKPRNEAEVFLTERTAYYAWQMDRSVRAQSARLYMKAETGGFEEEKRLERETVELTQRLFRAPFGRPTACAYAATAEAHAGESSTGEFDYGDHPKRLIGQLEATKPGCEWLLEQWSELAATVQKGLGWQAAERFRAFRLLGMHPIDAIMSSRMARFFQALEVLDPGCGSLVSEFWNEVVTVDAIAELEAQYRRAIDQATAPDLASARQHVLDIILWETDRIELDLRMIEKRAELKSELDPHLRTFDDSREGELMRRYELSCQRLFFRHMDEVYRRRAEKAERGEPPHVGGYHRPTPLWFQAIRFRGASAVSDDRGDGTDAVDSAEEHDMSGTQEAREVVRGDARVRRGPAPRNEPNALNVSAPQSGINAAPTPERGSEGDGGAGLCGIGAGENPELRNEPNGAGRQPAIQIRLDDVMAEVEQTIATQAPGVIVPGQRRDRGHGNAVSESRGQRKRRERNRRNAERAKAEAGKPKRNN